MENQNASAEYPHIPAKGSLQAAMPMAALRSLPPLQRQHIAKKHL